MDRIGYRPERDELWFAGDLVNRGQGSVECLDWLRQHPIRAVLGNHDLHAIAVLLGLARPKRSDTLDGLLGHPNASELLDWLLALPMTQDDDHWMSHAGLYPEWTAEQASTLAQETCQAWLAAPEAFFSTMYGNHPDRWDEALNGQDRHRFVVNALTRMRFLNPDHSLNMTSKGSPLDSPDLLPWFLRTRPEKPILFGHWAALPDREPAAQVIALDSGCVWGQHLSAYNLDTHQWVQQPADPKDLAHV